MTLHYLHIPKTGGIAVKQAIRSLPEKPRGLRLHGHGFTLPDVAADRPDARAIFTVRDIVPRYVSGFNARLRKGQPRTLAEWDEGERVSFRIFPTANDLAESLSSRDPAMARMARTAMSAIWHTRFPLSFWLWSVDYLRQNAHRIIFILDQRTLDDDFETLKTVAPGLASANLPGDPVARHQMPDEMAGEISALGETNILDFYRDDIPILEWCREQRLRILDGR